MTLSADFRNYAIGKLTDYCAQIARCVKLLSVEQVWSRSNERSNSVGNLLLHLRGNVSQWVLEGLGGRRYERDRPAEFAQREALPPDALMAALDQTIRDACAVIAALPDSRLGEAVTIQGYQTTVLAAVFHVVEHFAFHTGQIVWATKAMLNVDLSLYDAQGQRLDRRATGAP